MASTNKTQNYELSQYIGSDKPTYLGDYNADMLKIDTQMKRNADNVASVGATATTASETANTAIANASSAQTSADNAQTSANTANNTATTALQKANANEANISYIFSMFNLTNIKQYETSELTNVQNISTFNNCNLTLATNNDKSIYKLYGTITFGVSATGLFKIKISSTLLPETPYRVNNAGIVRIDNSNGLPSNAYYEVNTNGDIVITGYTNAIGITQIYLTPCIYFNKNFGDIEE